MLMGNMQSSFRYLKMRVQRLEILAASAKSQETLPWSIAGSLEWLLWEGRNCKLGPDPFVHNKQPVKASKVLCMPANYNKPITIEYNQQSCDAQTNSCFYCYFAMVTRDNRCLLHPCPWQVTGLILAFWQQLENCHSSSPSAGPVAVYIFV